MPRPASPAPAIAALAVAAVLAGALPGGRWSDALALLASVAALYASYERRHRDMLVAAGLAAGLAPAGLLLAPLAVGLAIRRDRAAGLPLAAMAGALAFILLPWPTPAADLPNLAKLANMLPAGVALVVALAVGATAWLGARASALPPTALFAEARLGALVLASILPLPLGTLAFVLTIAALPLPLPCRRNAANDNAVRHRIVGLAA